MHSMWAGKAQGSLYSLMTNVKAGHNFFLYSEIC